MKHYSFVFFKKKFLIWFFLILWWWWGVQMGGGLAMWHQSPSVTVTASTSRGDEKQWRSGCFSV